jgi:hypothetical protein
LPAVLITSLKKQIRKTAIAEMKGRCKEKNKRYFDSKKNLNSEFKDLNVNISANPGGLMITGRVIDGMMTAEMMIE